MRATGEVAQVVVFVFKEVMVGLNKRGRVKEERRGAAGLLIGAGLLYDSFFVPHELRRQLILKGITNQSTSDHELILISLFYYHSPSM